MSSLFLPVVLLTQVRASHICFGLALSQPPRFPTSLLGCPPTSPARRAIHTNLRATFKCDSLKLAMIKTERLALKLFGTAGALYDCVCKYDVGR